MSYPDCFMLMGMGGFFVLLGIGGIVWGNREGGDYYDSLVTHHDVREFVERSPGRPEPSALKVGGWIAIALGLVMLVGGGALWFWG